MKTTILRFLGTIALILLIVKMFAAAFVEVFSAGISLAAIIISVVIVLIATFFCVLVCKLLWS